MIKTRHSHQCKHFFLTLIFVLISFTTLCPQTTFFEHLQIENGLSELTVQAIYQDEFERMWIATKDGLNLYDGKTIEVFRPVIGDTTSIMGHNVLNVTGNRNGKIYIHCMAGVSEYDLRSEKFQILLGEGVERMYMGKDRLWVSLKNKLSYLNTETAQVEHYHTFNESVSITSILECEDGKLYIGTWEHGLIVLAKNKEEDTLLHGESIVCTFLDSRKQLWVGTLKNGLYTYSSDNKIQNYRHDLSDRNSISNNFVRTINEDHCGNLWIGTFKGLNKLDISNNIFTHFLHREQVRYSLGNNSIWNITKDMQGSLWVGSYYGGVDIFYPENLFNFYTTNDNEYVGLCGGIVGRIVEDEKGNMWICSENTGLNFFDRENHTFKNYYNKDLGINTKVDASLKDIYYDSAYDCIWIGTHLDGLHKMSLKSKQSVRINFTNKTSGNDYVRCIIPYRKDALLLGTHNSVYLFDKKTNTAKPLLENAKNGLAERQIWDMFIDSKGRFWFSTSSDIYCYQFDVNKLSRYRHDSGNEDSLQRGNLFVFTEDNDHHIWIGSAGGGVSMFDEEKKIFLRFDTSNSEIIDNYVVDIAITPMNFLIIATNKGISRFNIKDKTFNNYHNQDIFPFSGLKDRALHVSRLHELVVGGVYGMVIMNEDKLNIEIKKYNINLSRLYVNNIRVKPGDKTRILKESLPYTDKIELYSHKHTVFSLDFAVSNYIRTLHPVIHYKLEGFDNNWIPISINDKITYTNLSPGVYTLIIESAEYQSNLNKAYRELKIVIHPPYYASTFAYILYSFLFIVAVALSLFYYSSHIKLKSSLEYAEKEKTHIEQLNQMKMQFFTNISHELRTPITLITSQMESILRIGHLSSTISRKTLSALRNADKMNRLLTELLDFRRQELGYLKLKISEQDIVKYIKETCYSFCEYAIEKKIEFRMILPEFPVYVWFDRVQLEKVIYNLLTNAFRFTPENGKIMVEVTKENDHAAIRVSDSGDGIQPGAIPHVFDHFYQENSKSQYRGSAGIGLALAKGIVDLHDGSIRASNGVDGGAVFTICLRLSDEHFDYNKVEKTDIPEGIISPNRPETIAISSMQQEQSQVVESAANETAKEKYKILLVEDNQDVMNVLIDVFSPYYEIYTAKEGMSALEKAKKNQPDLILSDIMMPVMDGLDLCKKIKSNIDTSHIPVVLLTARAAVEHIIFGLSNGADDYVIKPFNSNILLARCNSVINNRKKLQAIYSRNPKADTRAIAINNFDQQLLDKATQIVEANLADPTFDIGRFAKEMCLGRTNLFQKIKGIAGQTPNDFILNIRLKKSLTLLKQHPDMPIYQIAELVGFDEDTYFMKCFKKHFGKTPSQYRNE